jgi:signal-transduction protein with cAMP-binding, CBS, and nucleotidyltransferase domain
VAREASRGSVHFMADRHLEIERGGQPCAATHAGDLFGESAPLLDCPRTASVTAAEDAVLLALGSDDFHQTVTGHPRSAAASNANRRIRTRSARAA